MTPEKLHVLSVDDDPTEAVLLRRMLEQAPDWDAELFTADSSADGLAALTQHPIDIVLLDYQLGAENGLTLLGAIREAGYTCPVVFLTGQGDEELVLEALRAGASDYLPKASLSPNSLRRTIRNAVERRRLEGLVREHQEVLRRTNADLERRNTEVTRFYHTLSHELKTPLTSAIEFIAIVLDGLAGPVQEAQAEYLGIARTALREMAVNIEDLVDSTRLETGKLRIDPVPGDLAELVGQVTRSFESKAEAQRITLGCSVDGGLPEATFDATRMAQIMRNLLSNALKFTPAEGSIVVRVGRAKGPTPALEVSVADTGRGIPEDHLPRIFDRLHQVKDDDYATVGGLGLGLNICRELVELHGGEISVESVLDVGTTFRFTVPAHSSETAPAPHEEALQS